MSQKLNRLPKFAKNDSKVLIIVMDGVGIYSENENLTRAVKSQVGIAPTLAFTNGNAVNAAYTPQLNSLMDLPLSRTLKAHGPAVGLPSEDDMGNSEVGHNALGAGRVFSQGAKLVNQSIESKLIFKSETWKKVIERPQLQDGNKTLHFIGLLSDGNVHSHINHLFALIRGAKDSGVKRVRLHVLLDGRDVPPNSAMTYADMLKSFLHTQASNDFDCQVASGGGRMVVTMDRYDSDWSIVKRGYNAHVLGEAPHKFSSLEEAITAFRKDGFENDQKIPPFVITGKNNAPLGKILDDDSVVLFNFRGDRAIQISKALTQKNFTGFERKYFPKVIFAGMMQYDGDLHLPELFLVNPPQIDNTLGELLSKSGVRQFACSETQKFGHVTYFWNGNRSGKFDEKTENYVEISSDLTPFEQRPWMKSAEIADETIRQMQANSFDVGRINFANGDMVGHTGDFTAAVLAVAATDLAIGRILEAAKKTNTIVIVTADHGNADEMFERDKTTGKVVLDKQNKAKIKTSHTLAPVPFAIFNSEALGVSYELRDDLPNAGLANVAATALMLAGFEPPAAYEPSLIKVQTDESKKKELIRTHKKERDAPENARLAQSCIAFGETIARLRAPDGCPWDKEQTVSSLTKYLIEETYEAVQAAQSFVRDATQETSHAFADELGDVLLQIFLNAQISSEQKHFSVEDVFEAINAKMIRRHPHVFSDAVASNSSDVVALWAKVKTDEKKQNGVVTASLMDKATKKRSQPTLKYAQEVAERSYKIGFAWDTLEGVFDDFTSEVEEFRAEIFAQKIDWKKAMDELGDIVYALACVTAHLNKRLHKEIHFDECARAATEKFVTRFKEMEIILAERKTPLSEDSAKLITLDDWNALWKLAKERRYQ